MHSWQRNPRRATICPAVRPEAGRLVAHGRVAVARTRRVVASVPREAGFAAPRSALSLDRATKPSLRALPEGIEPALPGVGRGSRRPRHRRLRQGSRKRGGAGGHRAYAHPLRRLSPQPARGRAARALQGARHRGGLLGRGRGRRPLVRAAWREPGRASAAPFRGAHPAVDRRPVRRSDQGTHADLARRLGRGARRRRSREPRRFCGLSGPALVARDPRRPG